MAEKGFGLWHNGRRSRAILEKVYLRNPLNGQSEIVYDGSRNLVINVDSAVCTGKDIEEAVAKCRTDAVTIDFVSITRLKYQGSYVTTPFFHVVIRNLLRRISTLAYFYQSTEMDIDFKGLVKISEKISHEDISIRWNDFQRYSGRTKGFMDFSGLTGSIRYIGDLKPFLPLLVYGSFVNVGKGATFGLGQYIVMA